MNEWKEESKFEVWLNEQTKQQTNHRHWIINGPPLAISKRDIGSIDSNTEWAALVTFIKQTAERPNNFSIGKQIDHVETQ